MRRARFCGGGGYETPYTENTFFSNHRLIEGSPNPTYRVATLSISKLDVTTLTRAIGVDRACSDAIQSEHVVAAAATYF